MFTAADALKKILATKPTTLMVLNDEDGYEFETFTEAEYNKAKKVQYIHVPDRKTVRADDLATVNQPKGLDYDDFLIHATDVKKITMVEIGGRLTTMEDFKKIKPVREFEVDLRATVGYCVKFTKTGMNIGCQRWTWAEWQKKGKDVIDHHCTGYSSKDQVHTLLNLILENKDRIIAKLTSKPVAKKIAVKKASVKKKTTKRR